MLKVKIDNGAELELDIKKQAVTIDGKAVAADIIKIHDNKYHLLLNDRSVTIELISKDETGKQMDILVNGVKRQVAVKDQYDQLLHQLGMDKMLSSKVNDIKAPMPGLVLSIKVKEGDAVKKGDPLLTLEAMKMENMIKAPADAVVKKINATERTAVDKGAVLIVME